MGHGLVETHYSMHFMLKSIALHGRVVIKLRTVYSYRMLKQLVLFPLMEVISCPFELITPSLLLFPWWDHSCNTFLQDIVLKEVQFP